MTVVVPCSGQPAFAVHPCPDMRHVRALSLPKGKERNLGFASVIIRRHRGLLDTKVMSSSPESEGHCVALGCSCGVRVVCLVLAWKKTSEAQLRFVQPARVSPPVRRGYLLVNSADKGGSIWPSAALTPQRCDRCL